MRPLFADPRTDFVFKKIFGAEEHKPLLMALLNGLLELDEAHRVVEVELLSAEQRPKVQELKYSIVDVKCTDARGTHYVVEMQVLNVEGFEKRVVYNVAKAYTGQLDAGQRYPDLDDVIGVTICDFELWPQREVPGVPMLSRWRMQEQHGGARGLGQLQFVFLELPKYDASRPPRTVVEKWAYFFRETRNLQMVPEVLAERPFKDALEAARVARFTDEEWEAYIRAGMALQDERGALSLARKEGLREGLREGKQEGLNALREALSEMLRQRGLVPGPQEQARLEGCEDLGTLQRWLVQALTATSVTEALR
ncbi:Rpn family recombination-promoting nuclease/putative transposase [Archangium lansingense]|uniref:Rpn family recombination-promoting nuclease/putative transposase n=1 Tax=Archangium lansingense TaxID=2995310 RepID=A0ABT3ZZY1_9BACT|nr:Rpn family recombination-promoting nuclease/putative transposase [Archangium lansinium]MCY1074955.1 Rpn family recombination-promoting nuclease/putative transposase [Archangium lansinium]